MIKTMVIDMYRSFLILFLMFCILSWYVMQQPDNTIDQNILTWFQQLHTEHLTALAQGLAVVGGLPITLVFTSILFGYGYLKRDYFTCFFVLFGVIITTSITWLLKWGFSRPRPFIDTQLVETYGSSYPSAHSAYAMMLACILLYIAQDMQYRRWMVSFALLWFVIMGCSRIYVGAHYFTDVVAGWIVAVLVMLLIKTSLDRYGIKQTTNETL